jgi:hypothetical protein
MASFQKTILILAILFFIVILVFIGLMLWKNQTSQPWPPSVPTCPDYWVAVDSSNAETIASSLDFTDFSFNYDTISNASGSGNYCYNVQGLGISGSGISGSGTGTGLASKKLMDFSKYSTSCEKYNWAVANNVAWDGITYGTLYSPCYSGSGDYLAGADGGSCASSMFGQT